MTETPEGILSLDDAVDRLMTDQEATTDEAEQEPDEGTPAEAEPDEAGDDADEDTVDEAGEDEPDDDDPEFEIDTPKGAQRLKLSELRAGYLRQADYTRKTMEAADQRRAVEQERAEATQLKQQLSEALQTWAVPTEQDPDWINLAQTLDPREFNARRVQWEQRQQVKQAAREQYEQLRAYEQAQTIAKEQEALFEAFPDWREPAKFREVAGKLATGAEVYGFSAPEVSNIVDHRFVRVLSDAIAYRDMMARQPATAKRVVKPNVSLKPGSKPNQDASRDAARKQQLSRLKQTGRMEDAIDLLLSG